MSSSNVASRLARLEQQRRAAHAAGTRKWDSHEPWNEDVERVDCGQGTIIEREPDESLDAFRTRVSWLTVWHPNSVRQISAMVHEEEGDEDWTEEDTENVVRCLIEDRRALGLPDNGLCFP